jgi:hypothetical protein
VRQKSVKAGGKGKEKESDKASANRAISETDTTHAFVLHSTQSYERGGWFVDSGAKDLMCNQRSAFRSYTPLLGLKAIVMGVSSRI